MAWRVQPGLQGPGWAALLVLEQERKLLMQVQVLESQDLELGPGQELVLPWSKGPVLG